MAKKPTHALLKEPPTPECEKLRLINEQGHNKMIGDFLGFIQGLTRILMSGDTPPGWWIDIEEIEIADLLNHLACSGEFEWEDEVIEKFWQWLVEIKGETKLWDIRVEDTLYEYFDLDRNKIENERREMLAYCSAGNALSEARENLGLSDG